MATAVIICNGEFPVKEYPLYLLRSADYIVCCDGAAVTYMRRCRRIFGRVRLPDAIVGDMDSLPASFRKKFGNLVVPVSEQDYNDMNKAVRHVMSHCKGLEAIHILGAGGKREDHTVGNLSYLMEYAMELGGLKEKKALGGLEIPSDGSAAAPEIDMVSDWTTAFAVTDSCSFFAGEGREISIFSPDSTLKITSEGLRWQTSGVVFDNWWKATLNIADSDEVRLTLSHPAPALIILN